MISINVQDHVSASLQNMAHNLHTLPMAEIARIMVASVHQNFLDEGRPTSWEPRAEPTGSWPILRKSRDLYNSIEAFISGNDITVDHNTSYGDFHETGTWKMPARPFLIIVDEDIAEIDRVIEEHMSQI
jgi:phage gpG-like protein